MVVDARTLTVPAADEARFLAEFAVQLRQKVELTSTDGSVRLPSPTEPRLALDIDFQPGHRVGLDWTAIYDVGDELRRFPLAAPVEARSIRDLAAERELIAALDLPDGRAADRAGRPGRRPVRRAGAARADRSRGGGRPAGRRPRLPATESAPVAAGHARADGRTRADWFDLHLNGRDGRRGGAVRRAVRRADPGRGVHDLGDRRLLRARPAGVQPAAGADRGVQGAG